MCTGITIQSRQLDINTVAAGGGSRLFYRNKIFVVGPESVSRIYIWYCQLSLLLNWSVI